MYKDVSHHGVYHSGEGVGLGNLMCEHCHHMAFYTTEVLPLCLKAAKTGSNAGGLNPEFTHPTALPWGGSLPDSDLTGCSGKWRCSVLPIRPGTFSRCFRVPCARRCAGFFRRLIVAEDDFGTNIKLGRAQRYG